MNRLHLLQLPRGGGLSWPRFVLMGRRFRPLCWALVLSLLAALAACREISPTPLSATYLASASEVMAVVERAADDFVPEGFVFGAVSRNNVTLSIVVRSRLRGSGPDCVMTWSFTPLQQVRQTVVSVGMANCGPDGGNAANRTFGELSRRYRQLGAGG